MFFLDFTDYERVIVLSRTFNSNIKKNLSNVSILIQNQRMVFSYQNFSGLLREKNVLVIEKKLLKFEAEGREYAHFLRSLEQFIQTVKGQNNFR